jgi:hypothetical protein
MREVDNFSQLYASYQMQLLVRFDRGRQALIYEAFEYKPVLLSTFEAALAADQAPVTEDELLQVEDLLKRTSLNVDKLFGMMRTFPGGGTDMGSGKIEIPPRHLPHIERCRQYGAEVLHIISSWIRYKHSIVRRIRFPVSAIVGATLVECDLERPYAHLCPAKGQVPFELVLLCL